MNSISFEETPHFALDSHDRCPHLYHSGLYRIILNVGEEYLCNICREHPGFYNNTRVAEVGLGISCREAAKVAVLASIVSEEIEYSEENTKSLMYCINEK